MRSKIDMMTTLVNTLLRAVKQAQKLNMDIHFQSDLDHLIVTASTNLMELCKESRNAKQN